MAIEKICDSYLETDSNAALWVSAEYAEKMTYHYYEQAALKGLASAEFKQAMMHKEGKGTPKNIGMAQYMLHKSALQNFAPALKEYDQNPSFTFNKADRKALYRGLAIPTQAQPLRWAFPLHATDSNHTNALQAQHHDRL